MELTLTLIPSVFPHIHVQRCSKDQGELEWGLLMAKCESAVSWGSGLKLLHGSLWRVGHQGLSDSALEPCPPPPTPGWVERPGLGPRCRQTEYHKVEFNLPNIHVGLWSLWLGTSEASVGQGSGPRPGSEENAEGQPTGGHGLPGRIPEPLPGREPEPISGNHFPSQPLPRAPILITARTSDVT